MIHDFLLVGNLTCLVSRWITVPFLLPLACWWNLEFGSPKVSQRLPIPDLQR